MNTNEYEMAKRQELVAKALSTSKIRHINKRFEDAGVINDEELDILIAQYNDGIRARAPLGPEFKLARNELIRRLETCEAWKQARKEQAERYAKYQNRRKDLW